MFSPRRRMSPFLILMLPTVAAFVLGSPAPKLNSGKVLLSSPPKGIASPLLHTALGPTSPTQHQQRMHPPRATKARTALDEMGKDGAFVRKESAWRNSIENKPDAKFAAEADRYHLYVSYACPWANRALLARSLKGLQDVIGYTAVHPTWRKTRPDDPDDKHTGWVFGNPNGEAFPNSIGLGGPFPPAFDVNEPDPFHEEVSSIRDLYEKAGDVEGKYTVPVLWDKKLNTIVSNESADIIRMLNSEFNDLAKNPGLDLYPEKLREAIEEANAWIYPSLNDGVYRCGFATSQQAYDKAIVELTKAFDRLASLLEKQRFVAGDQFTEADIRLFVTLVRYEEVYTCYFKCNTRFITTTPSILNYCREVYQMPGVAETVNMDQIKTHYYTSHPNLNRWSIIPKGSNFIKLLEMPHDRDSLSSPTS